MVLLVQKSKCSVTGLTTLWRARLSFKACVPFGSSKEHRTCKGVVVRPSGRNAFQNRSTRTLSLILRTCLTITAAGFDNRAANQSRTALFATCPTAVNHAGVSAKGFVWLTVSRRIPKAPSDSHLENRLSDSKSVLGLLFATGSNPPE